MRDLRLQMCLVGHCMLQFATCCASTLFKCISCSVKAHQLHVQDGAKRTIVAVLDSMLAQLRAHLTRAVTVATNKLRDMCDELETSDMQEVRIQCTALTP